MPNTTNGLPYPARTGVPPDAQADLLALALALDPLAQDTGWVALTLTGTGWSNVEPLGYRIRGGVVYLRGEIVAAGGTTTGASNTIATLPSAARPAKRLRVPWGWNTLGFLGIETTGAIWSSIADRSASPGNIIPAISWPA